MLRSSSTPSPALDIIGVGAPIVDTLAQVPENFLRQVKGAKGGMELVDAAGMAELLAALPPGSQSEAPGGSAGNTVFCLARLGLKTAFLGKTGDDTAGKFYRERFHSFGGDTRRFKDGTGPNARCLSLVTPDAERTMRTHLGAHMTLVPEEISAADFASCRLAYVEGYTLFNRALMMRVLESSQAAGCKIGLDLASFEVVAASRDILPELLDGYVDLVFANLEEATTYFGPGKSPEEMAHLLGEQVTVAVVKLGAQGSLIYSDGKLTRVPPVLAPKVVDTTGAGDLWAAGFLYGYLTGADLATSGHYGSLLGAEIVQVMGAELPEARFAQVRAHLH